MRDARLLLVDDSENVRLIIRTLLAEWNVEITEAFSGPEALNLVESSAWDIVLMDVQMPGMDVLQVIRAIRSRETVGVGSLPIIALAEQGELKDMEQYLEAGMNECLTKPVESSELLGMLARWIPLHRKSDFFQVDFEKTEISSDTLHSGHLPDEMPWLTFKATLENLGGDLSFYLELLQQYVEEKSDVGSRLRQTLEEGNLKEAISLAHGLKGVTGILGLEKLAAVSRHLEEALLEGESTRIAQFLERLEREQAVALDSLKDFLHDNGMNLQPAGVSGV